MTEARRCQSADGVWRWFAGAFGSFVKYGPHIRRSGGTQVKGWKGWKQFSASPAVVLGRAAEQRQNVAHGVVPVYAAVRAGWQRRFSISRIAELYSAERRSGAARRRSPTRGRVQLFTSAQPCGAATKSPSSLFSSSTF